MNNASTCFRLTPWKFHKAELVTALHVSKIQLLHWNIFHTKKGRWAAGKRALCRQTANILMPGSCWNWWKLQPSVLYPPFPPPGRPPCITLYLRTNTSIVEPPSVTSIQFHSIATAAELWNLNWRRHAPVCRSTFRLEDHRPFPSVFPSLSCFSTLSQTGDAIKRVCGEIKVLFVQDQTNWVSLIQKTTGWWSWSVIGLEGRVESTSGLCLTI